jgi:hypothetical protein
MLLTTVEKKNFNCFCPSCIDIVADPACRFLITATSSTAIIIVFNITIIFAS